MTAPNTTDRMEEALKPCPFCGGEAQVISNAAKGRSWVQCSRCFAESGGYEELDQAMHTLRDQAAQEWNRRDSSPTIGEEAMEAARDLFEDSMFRPFRNDHCINAVATALSAYEAKGRQDGVREGMKRAAGLARDEIDKHNTGSGFDSQPAYTAAFAIYKAILSNIDEAK